MSLYSTAYKYLSGVIKWFYQIKVEGAENEPEEGGYIACANHLSNSDVVIVAVALKRQVRFFAKSELFRIPLLKQLITALGAYPVKRGTGDVGAIKKTIGLLEGGEPVCVFPQGTRCAKKDPRETEVKSGVAMMSYRSGCPVLPMLIQCKKYKILPFRKTYVRIGKPIMPEDMGIAHGGKEYQIASEKIFEKVTDMIEDDNGNS